jgi:hypothetical protein
MGFENQIVSRKCVGIVLDCDIYILAIMYDQSNTALSAEKEIEGTRTG